ncbi:MAG: trypsin-like peptidase domain-containing protein [Oscillospiraceae bacterium]|nr:trypsin-like peptidase domain-containing protein [Oscillospiraceae bacterium]
MYDDFNHNSQQPNVSGEYHYSYRSDAQGFQPSQYPVESKPKKKRRIGKIIAVILCGALLTGGAFGAGWYLNRDGGRSGTRMMVSDRPLAQVETVSVTGSEKLTFSQIYDANVESCVSINTTGTASVGYNIFHQQIQKEFASAGSGFVLTADGYVATNCHVIEGASSVKVTMNDGATYDAQIIGSDSDYDIAILKVNPGETQLKPVTIGTSGSLKVGEDVSTIGNPLGQLTFSLTHGVVSCLNREINLDGTPFNMVQVDTSINPGNSGGPLFNCYGEVVGIVTAKTSTTSSGTAAEGLGFAIPIDDVLSMFKDIMENGQITSHAWMGIAGQSVSYYPQSGMRSGVYVAEATENGPAAQAGLQEGDVITMLGTTTISTWSDLTSAMGSKTYKAGDTATVTFVRDGQVMTTELTFGSTTDKPQEDPQPAQSAQQPDNNSGNYGNPYDGYGSMEDFFNQFFGYGTAQGSAA